MSDKIYVIGHKVPDLDSVVAAISYANFKNKKENTEKYQPVVTGEINEVTKFVLKKFGFEEPNILEDAEEKNLILVDHNEFSHAIKGIEKANIVEILDHHKVNFNYSNPIEITVKPWGSSNTIIYEKYIEGKIEIKKEIAGLILSAVLDDTVIAKSPTCTDIDKKVLEELAGLAEIESWEDYGLEMFKVKSSVSKMTAREIIKLDYKDYEYKTGKFGFGQVETVDLKEVQEREEELKKDLEELRDKETYHTVTLVITDILKKGSKVLVATSDEDGVNKALGKDLENGAVYIDGLMSRKKQVIPPFTEIFDK